MSKHVSAKDIAAKRRLPVGRILYLRRQFGFPRPVEKRGREWLFDRSEVEQFFKNQRWSARC